MKLGHILHYDMVFSGEMPELSEIAKQIPTQLGLEYCAYFNSIMHLKGNSEEAQRKCFNQLIIPDQPELMKTLLMAGDLQVKKYGQYHMFDPYIHLTVINALLQNRNGIDVGAVEATAPQKELLIKAVLRANQKLSEDYLRLGEKEADPLTRFCKLMWPNIVMTGGHRLRSNFMFQAYKSIKLLEYLQSQPELWSDFVSYYNLGSERSVFDFTKEILAFYMHANNVKEDDRLHHAYTLNVEGVYPIIARFVLNLNDFDVVQFKDRDFRTLRTKPVIKIRENRYIVTDWNFVLQKMTTGLLFDLFENTGLKKRYNGRLDTFKGKIGFEFSEKLFATTFQNIIVRQKDSFSAHRDGIKQSTDFYYRKHHKIALIEFKDPLLVKPMTYEEVKVEIDKKLNDTNKGTGQLKSQLDKFIKNLNIYEAV